MDLAEDGHRLRGGSAQRLGDAALRGPVDEPSQHPRPPYLSAVRGAGAATDTEESRVHLTALLHTRPARDVGHAASSALRLPVIGAGR